MRKQSLTKKREISKEMSLTHENSSPDQTAGMTKRQSKRIRVDEKKEVPEEMIPTDPNAKITFGFKKMIQRLQTSQIPNEAGFRTKEKDHILNFIRSNFTLQLSVSKSNESQSTMIVFGQPGLGKTLIISEIINQIAKVGLGYLFGEDSKSKTKGFDLSVPVKSIYLNAMNSAGCPDALKEIIKRIDSNTKFIEDETINSAEYLLQTFKNSLQAKLKECYYVILIDELETLSDNDKKNFNLILELLNINMPRFVKICVSNTLNLFTNVNGNLLYLNFEYLIFKPYPTESLVGILKSRLAEALQNLSIAREEVLSDKAVEFIVKKAVNHNSSDVRFILSVTQEILSERLASLEESVKEGETLQKDDLRIGLGDISEKIDKKLNNEASEIIVKLSLPIQVLLYAIYATITEEHPVCEMVL
jgi:Cdc6-like AAA superfamily ATPase